MAAVEAQTLDAQVDAIKSDIKDEYRMPHQKPWVVGFSGGKDSTLVLHLVIESVLELPYSERTRPIHIVSNDTLVESPIVQSYVDDVLGTLSAALPHLKLPVTIEKTSPATDQTFWVNVIGRGYPPPTRLFRWCTDRMKIRPTTGYIRETVSASGEVILLLGVRRSESAARAASAKRYDNGDRLNRHNDIQGCWVFRPILELTTESVWEYLSANKAPWAGAHTKLVNLYRNASGGDCPIVIDPDAQPSCGSSSIRFGCWTCTVVDKDKSFKNQIENGFEALEPMANFREWLKAYCYTESNRMKQRRNGQAGLGPLTFEARKRVLDDLLVLQEKVNQSLINEHEIKLIHQIWKQDESQNLIHKANKLLALMGTP
jgi:DNA sulfur modification protein DndC